MMPRTRPMSPATMADVTRTTRHPMAERISSRNEEEHIAEVVVAAMERHGEDHAEGGVLSNRTTCARRAMTSPIGRLCHAVHRSLPRRAQVHPGEPRSPPG